QDNIEEINEFFKKPKKDFFDIRLTTLYTFIKCIAYSEINCENNGFEYETNLFPDITSQLQVDICELISLIEKLTVFFMLMFFVGLGSHCMAFNKQTVRNNSKVKMEKILFVNGSPNRNGNTAALAKVLL
ncbi:MAG: hypothetical protein ACI4TS_06630, partial [Bacteroidaceae bacterium]